MIGEKMESEIREQPAILAREAPRYAEELAKAFARKKYEMVLLAARGSSDNAALYARYLIEIHLNIPVSLAAPSVITRFGSKMAYPKCLAIGISQSGAAPDVAEVLAFMRRSGHSTLAITNTAGSRLTQEAEHSLLLNAGPENSVAATKTYTASLLALYELVRALGGELKEATGRIPTQAWMEECEAASRAGLGPVIRQNVLFALGRGYGFATCQESALKLMECALLPCKAYSTADFQHGPKALAGPESAAIVYGEPPAGLSDFGCVPVTAPKGPEGALNSLWEVMFGQYLALHAARVRGLDPDAPRNLSKVTLTL